MKSQLVFIGLSCFLFNVSAQVTFQKAYHLISDSYGASLAKTNDGGSIVAGYAIGNGWDVFVVRTDANGNNLWTRYYGGSMEELAKSIQQTSDGGFIITGDGYDGIGNDMFLIKIDGNGNILWTKSFPSLAGFNFAFSVQQTTDAGYIVTGGTTLYGAGSMDVYLVKTDSTGNIQWTKTYGGTLWDVGNCVKQTTDGGYIVAGNSKSFGTLNSVYLIKTDAAGDTLWTEIINEADTGNLFNESYSLAQTSDGGYILSGISKLNGVYVVKTTTSGAVQWSRTIAAGSENKGSSVKETSDGSFIIAGHIRSPGIDSSDAYLIKIDNSGNMLWSKTYGDTGNDFASDVEQTADGGYLLTGMYSNFPTQDRNVYLRKTDSAGNSGCNENNPLSIMTSPTAIVSHPATVVLSGSNSSTVPFITGTGGQEQTLCFTGITESGRNNNSFFPFPNPAGNELRIRSSDWASGKTIEIYHVMGNKVYCGPITKNQGYISLDISGLSPGIYFIKAGGVQRFIKQ